MKCLFAILHCRPLPSKQSARTFLGLSSYFRESLVFGDLQEPDVLYLLYTTVRSQWHRLGWRRQVLCLS